jgi:phosphatidylinositol kinase/protein kinase (PI-3  family)
MRLCLGIDGTFRITCENVMRVLRSNADSVVAVLEAFVHDPLIDWFKQGHGATKHRRMAPGAYSDVSSPPLRHHSRCARVVHSGINTSWK